MRLRLPVLNPQWIGLLAFMGAVPCARPAIAESAQAIFRQALSYTVRIRTQIHYPFVEDERGAFEGAGFLVDAKRGWILTNAHVVGRSPSTVQAAFADEEFQSVEKIYVDSYTDMAVLALSGNLRGRKAAVIDDDEPSVGEPVGVFGHPLGIPFTGTRGIISGKTSQFGPDLLQTDATVDHGNSGGPVIRLSDGRVIGIATAAAGGSKADRINFATPMKDAARILAILQQGGRPEPPRLGIALMVDEDDQCTMRVGAVHDPERWPLMLGDLIVSGSGANLKTMNDLIRACRGLAGHVPLTIERDQQRMVVNVTPAFGPPVVDRRGVVIDGALIAPTEFDDAVSLRDAPALQVHSVAPGSASEALGI